MPRKVHYSYEEQFEMFRRETVISSADAKALADITSLMPFQLLREVARVASKLASGKKE